MDSISDEQNSPRRPRSRRKRGSWSIRLTPLGIVVVSLCNLAVLAALASPLLQSAWGIELPFSLPFALPQISKTVVQESITPSVTPSPSKTIEPATPSLPPPSDTPTIDPEFESSLYQGLVVLALDEGANSHLFAYQPLEDQESEPLSLLRLTHGAWEDKDPVVSPDGRRVAFSSNRNGYWDLYTLDLVSERVERITDSLAYDGSPSWSPDGLWIVYESYIDDNLELFIKPTGDALAADPIRLTTNTAADHSPSWSPLGREIVFVSDRSGEPEIWLANLDQAEESQFRNLSQDPQGLNARPAWSPDGQYLAWSSVQDGYHHVLVWDAGKSSSQPRYLGSGDWPVWSPDGKIVMSAVTSPGQDYFTAYPVAGQGWVFPPLKLSGVVVGLDWADVALEIPLPSSLQTAARVSATPLWMPALSSDELPNGRLSLVELDDLQAPFPYFQDLVDESFQALRESLADQIGWDYLGSLENAYVPLSAPLDPGFGDDWLYTGRAFAANSAPLNAGWMMVMREDYGDQTFWRLYLRTRFQDGSAGEPLKSLPWDLNARYNTDPQAYEQGGELFTVVPEGYWFDFTRLASSYGWERLPALTAWRAAFAAARFNEFAFTAGLDWTQAMLEIYPPEILVTPTIVVPPSRTPTITPRWYQSPTPTQTLTPRPTLTPVEPTAAPAASATQAAVSTPTKTQEP